MEHKYNRHSSIVLITVHDDFYTPSLYVSKTLSRQGFKGYNCRHYQGVERTNPPSGQTMEEGEKL